MKQWIIPIKYEVNDQVFVKADTLEKAIETAKHSPLLALVLPTEEAYIGIIEIDEDGDIDYIRQRYNDGQKDEE